MPSTRTLSKSDFTLARTCDAKLYFRENGYSDNRERNPYLAMLAVGGYMVEALAKAKYPDGLQLEYGRDVAADAARTRKELERENVTLFEATLLVGRQQARVDVLQKIGNRVRLIEIKSKGIDGEEHRASLAGGKGGALRGKRPPYAILEPWMQKLEDITFQTLLLEKTLPGVTIEPFLVLVDKSKEAGLDNVPGLFELVESQRADGTKRIHTARYRGTTEQLAALDLVTEVDVSAEVKQLRDDVEDAAERFESMLDAPLSDYAARVELDAACGKCEFRENGFNECWGEYAHASPHMLELYYVSKAKAPDKSALVPWMLRAGTASLIEIPLDGIDVSPKPGGVGTRQRRQIEYTKRADVYVSKELRGHVSAVTGPMYFIDFETSRLALPYHAGMRPYGLVTFQWSCHTVAAPGETPTHAEWLNDRDVWPNQSFAESLRAAIGDDGPVLVWSPFEGSTMDEIIRDLARFGRDESELVDWIRDVIERRIVDLHEWARCDYYHPGMKGRTSIKVVLDALWKSDVMLRHQFEKWTGYTVDAMSDPYSGLPPAVIGDKLVDVHEGTGAMTAYQEMMYGAHRDDPGIRAKWRQLLLQYCSLDTLSMVLIFEHWRRLTA